jgi:hypothetical protein
MSKVRYILGLHISDLELKHNTGFELACLENC